MTDMRHPNEQESQRIMRAKSRLMDGLQAELVSGEISKPEALALFAHITGMVIAMQDQRDMTSDQAMEIVARNIQSGNASAIEQMFDGPGGSA